jgi:hypothetical protein
VIETLAAVPVEPDVDLRKGGIAMAASVRSPAI